MPAKRQRLGAADLKDTRGFSRRSSPLFIVRFRPKQLPRSRFAVIVSVKVDRRATERHKLKRRAYEHLRTRPGDRDVIITIMPAAKDLPRKKFIQELDKILP